MIHEMAKPFHRIQYYEQETRGRKKADKGGVSTHFVLDFTKKEAQHGISIKRLTSAAPQGKNKKNKQNKGPKTTTQKDNIILRPLPTRLQLKINNFCAENDNYKIKNKKDKGGAQVVVRKTKSSSRKRKWGPASKRKMKS